MATKIEWCDGTDGTKGETWNPIVGCSKASPGCDHCYAETMARRLRGMGMRGYEDVIGPHGKWTGRPAFVESELDKPRRWRKPRRVFVCSMSDIGHENVREEWRRQVWDVIRATPHHQYIVLTKRPEGWMKFIPQGVWCGVTMENRDYSDRYHLLHPGYGKPTWISFEPLLGPVTLSFYSHILPAWVVAGPETGPGARPMRVEWLENLAKECEDYRIPFFDKRKVGWLRREWPVTLKGGE